MYNYIYASVYTLAAIAFVLLIIEGAMRLDRYERWLNRQELRQEAWAEIHELGPWEAR